MSRRPVSGPQSLTWPHHRSQDSPWHPCRRRPLHSRADPPYLLFAQVWYCIRFIGDARSDGCAPAVSYEDRSRVPLTGQERISTRPHRLLTNRHRRPHTARPTPTALPDRHRRRRRSLRVWPDSRRLTGPTISHRLKVLRKAGLIDCERPGAWVYYRAVPKRVSALAHAIAPLVLTATADAPFGWRSQGRATRYQRPDNRPEHRGNLRDLVQRRWARRRGRRS